MNEEILDKLKRLKVEDVIWVVVIGIALLNLYSNYFEKLYVITGDERKRDIFRKINLTILIITILITLYFTALSYDNYIKSKKEEFLLPLISNVLFLVGGVILIYAFFKYVANDEKEAVI